MVSNAELYHMPAHSKLKRLKHKPPSLDLRKIQKLLAFLERATKSLAVKKASLAEMLEAKKHSDQGNYTEKTKILRKLMHKHPDDWVVDSDHDRPFPGVTHMPTGFRAHVLRAAIPEEMLSQPVKMSDLSPIDDVDQAWLGVPEQVHELVEKHAEDLLFRVRLAPDSPCWRFMTKVGVVTVPNPQQQPSYPLGPVESSPPVVPPTNELGLESGSKYDGKIPTGLPGLTQFGHYFGAAQKPFGGPNPLTASLLSGALGSLLGYGGGWVAEKLMPDRYRGDDFKKRMALLGGLLGGGGMLAAYGGPMAQAYGPKGLLMSGGFGEPPSAAKVPEAAPPAVPPPPVPMMPTSSANSCDTVLDRLLKRVQIKIGKAIELDDDMCKAADDMMEALQPTINVDAWNNVILPDPFASPRLKSVVIGMPMAAAEARGVPWVSPMDIAKIGVNMGVGAAMGSGLGFLAQHVLGLSPQLREDLQRGGALAGALASVTGLR